MAKKQNDLIYFPMHLSHEVERMFDEMIHRPWGFCREIRGWNPSLDLYETAEAFILEADLPGVKSEDVKVEMQNGDLVLEGWRSLEKNHSDGRYHTMERSSGQFIRRMKLPETVNKDAIQAEFKDGVLRVVLTKVKQRRGKTPCFNTGPITTGDQAQESVGGPRELSADKLYFSAKVSKTLSRHFATEGRTKTSNRLQGSFDPHN